MVEFESTGLKKLRNKIIERLIVEELLNEPEITMDRRDICAGCEHMNAKQCLCMVCGCFLEIKTKSKVNINPKTGQSEITHCPLDKWTDHFSKYGYDISESKSK